MPIINRVTRVAVTDSERRQVDLRFATKERVIGFAQQECERVIRELNDHSFSLESRNRMAAVTLGVLVDCLKANMD